MENGMTYLKGYTRDGSKRVIARIYDEPESNLTGDTVIATLIFMDDGSSKSFSDIEDFKDLVFCFRSITEVEFDYLNVISKLQNEVFMNQYTGGFPGRNECQSYASYLMRFCKEVVDTQLKLK